VPEGDAGSINVYYNSVFKHPVVRWNKNFTKLMKILIDFILFTLSGLQRVILAHINAV
jgi:hypothetical protein